MSKEQTQVSDTRYTDTDNNGIRLIYSSSRQISEQADEIKTLLPQINFENNSFVPSVVGQNLSVSDNSFEEIYHAILRNKAYVALYAANALPYPIPEGVKIIALIKTKEHTETITEEHPLSSHIAVIAKAGNKLFEEIFAPLDIRKNYGKAYLAGFGPGDPDLLTIKAQRALENADAIFYDDLIEKSYLENFKGEKTFVGKRKGNHSHTQDVINEMLYQSIISGKNTVRLKGGDPFIFGRGGEEYEYLHRRLIEPEVIPGITAAMGAAAQTAIPLTNRGESLSVAFVTASTRKELVIPQADTLVFYMGASNLKELREKVLSSGVNPETPAAIITNATRPYARATYTTLGDLPDETISPSVIMISKTIKNRNIMKSQPNVLVTGLTAHQYQNLGNVIHQPLVEIVPIEMPDDFFKFIRFVENYKYIIFTNPNTVKYFIEWVRSLGCNVNSLNTNIIVSADNYTTEELQKYGINPHYALESPEKIIGFFKEKGITDEEILLPRSDISPNTIPDGLRSLGNNVHSITVYYTQPKNRIQKVELADIDIIVFTSAAGVRSFLKHYGEIPNHIKVITKDDQTQEAYRRNSALYI